MATPHAGPPQNPLVRWLRMAAHGLRVALLQADPATPPEQRAKVSFGYRTRGARQGGGWLVLTEDKLVFERADPLIARFLLVRYPRFAVDLREISEVQRVPGDMFDRSPFVPVLSVTLASGGQLFFQLVDVNDWLDALGEAILINSVKRMDDAPTQS
jgi:hypothetical protein